MNGGFASGTRQVNGKRLAKHKVDMGAVATLTIGRSVSGSPDRRSEISDTLDGVLASPGKLSARYSLTGILSLRQPSTTERIAATRGPACTLPTWFQFFRLCEDLHNPKNGSHLAKRRQVSRSFWGLCGMILSTM